MVVEAVDRYTNRESIELQSVIKQRCLARVGRNLATAVVVCSREWVRVARRRAVESAKHKVVPTVQAGVVGAIVRIVALLALVVLDGENDHEQDKCDQHCTNHDSDDWYEKVRRREQRATTNKQTNNNAPMITMSGSGRLSFFLGPPLVFGAAARSMGTADTELALTADMAPVLRNESMCAAVVPS